MDRLGTRSKTINIIYYIVHNTITYYLLHLFNIHKTKESYDMSIQTLLIFVNEFDTLAQYIVYN